MRRVFIVTAALAGVLFCSPLPDALAQDSPRLLKVVALSRHGVRSPTQSPETLASWSSRAWPAWHTAPGTLTARGAALIEGEWTGLRETLAFDGLLPATECPPQGSVVIYADHMDVYDGADRPACGCSLSVYYGQTAGFRSSYYYESGSRSDLFCGWGIIKFSYRDVSCKCCAG